MGPAGPRVLGVAGLAHTGGAHPDLLRPPPAHRHDGHRPDVRALRRAPAHDAGGRGQRSPLQQPPASGRQGRCEATAHTPAVAGHPVAPRVPPPQQDRGPRPRAADLAGPHRGVAGDPPARPAFGEPRAAGREHRRLRRRDPPRPRAPCPHARGRRAPAPLRPPRRRHGSARALPHRLPRLGDRSGGGHRRADRSLAEHHVRRRRAAEGGGRRGRGTGRRSGADDAGRAARAGPGRGGSARRVPRGVRLARRHRLRHRRPHRRRDARGPRGQRRVDGDGGRPRCDG